MTTEVICANLENKLSQVLEFFTRFKIKHLPVLDNNKLVGIISISDMVWFLQKELEIHPLNKPDLDAQFNLGNIMTKNPFTLRPEDYFEVALKVLSENDFQAIPIAEDGEIKGIITSKDIVKKFKMESMPFEKAYSIDTPGFGL